MKYPGLHRAAALCAVLFLAMPLAHAQPTTHPVTLHFDPARTQIHWTLADVLHTVRGSFRLKGGLISFTPATGAAEGELLVDLDSGDSGSAARDRAMKKNILQTQTYPEAIFHPEKVSGSLEPGKTQEVTVDGTFTIHGQDHPLHMVVAAQMTDATHVHLTTHFVVPYVQWGMKDPSTFVLRVGKEVHVDVSADATTDTVR